MPTVDAAEHSGARLASRDEGEAIVQVAWELRRGLEPKPDCSHFVNAIYLQAGLDYEYARAAEIFDGIDSFQRVHRPQPGDLVVWQSHVGIVVDPDEHSFYSSVLSGFAIEDYRSNYWTSRGQPRFYRYLIDETHKARLVAHLNGPQLVPAPIQPVAGQAHASDVNPELRRKTSNPASARDTTSQQESGDPQISDAVFVSTHMKPSEQELEAALRHLADLNGERFLRHSVIRPSQSIVVYDQVAVAGFSVYDSSGWVELQLTEAGGSRDAQREVTPADRWRLHLRLEERGWVLLAPQNRIYLLRSVAIRVLADQVAQTSQVPASNREFKRAVRALDSLLSRETHGATSE